MSEAEKGAGIMAKSGGPNADAELVRREALDWLRRLTSGEVTRTDLAAFEDWRAESPRHRRALAEANLLWDVLGKVSCEADISQAARPLPGRPMARRALLAGATAAAAAAYLAVRPPFRLWPAVSELIATYRTGTGESRQLAIASGIVVRMDTQTSLTAPMDGGQLYSLELISGQLAVSVPAEAARSVVITAAGGQTRADQANFDVRRDGSSVCVTCAEGAVQVSYGGMATRLEPGQQVTYGDRVLGSPVAANQSVVTAWQRGLLIFHDVPLAKVVEEVNRYRPGRLILLNKTLAERKVVVGFRLDRINEVVDYIQQAFGAETRVLPGGVVLLG
jgi:transmembrane sensor